MNKREFARLAKKFGGWMEGEMAYFPSVHQKQRFEKALAEQS